MGFGGGEIGKHHETVTAGGSMTRRNTIPRFSGGGGGGGDKKYHVAAPRYTYHETAAGTRKHSRAVWRPAVPSWEKEFVLKGFGGLHPTWHKFLEAQKYIHLYDNIMQWDDEEAQESFRNSKTLFYAKTFNITENLETFTPPGPDLYIDNINSDDSNKIDGSELELLKGLESDTDDDEEEEEEEEESNATTQSKETSFWQMPIQNIQPTGWDVEPEEYVPKYLTGLIVGGH